MTKPEITGDMLKMRDNCTVLYIFSGLPASGKTILSSKLAQHINAVHLRIDTIEQALRDLCPIKVTGEGYRLAYRLASDNLKLGNSVIADSCNPIKLTRDEWEHVAIKNSSDFVNVEVQCSNEDEHKIRVEQRKSNIPDFILPIWESVKSREYDSWKKSHLVVDTASHTIDESFEELLSKLGLAIKNNNEDS